MKKKEENKNLKLSKVERYVRGPPLASGVFEVPCLVKADHSKLRGFGFLGYLGFRKFLFSFYQTVETQCSR